MLHVDDLHVSYGHVRAVRGVSFSVSSGEIVAMVGANGAGKTSTLNALTGLVAGKGSIRMDGRELCGEPTDAIVRHGMVQVPQGRQLFPEMSVRENLEMGAYLQAPAARRQQLDVLMGRFPLLRERAQQYAGTLSGGEQQLLAIGRALMASPRLLLLDEPCLGLSPIMVRKIAVVIRELNAQGLSILLAEQNAAFALALASQVVVIENGRVSMSGSAEELRGSTAIRRSYLGI